MLKYGISVVFLHRHTLGGASMREIRNILAVSCGYAAAVIGAGFASGQEIVSFFLRYGKMSILGIIVAVFMFSAFSYMVLSCCVSRKIDSYEELLGALFKRDYTRKAVEYATAFFAACTLCVMTACAGEMGMVCFGVGKIYGALVFSVICCAVFMLNAKKILQINSVLGAVIIFGIVFTCFYILRYREHQTFVNGGTIVLSGASYAGYNLLTVGALLAGMSQYLNNKKEVFLSSVVSGAVLFLMIALIWGVLGIYYGKINLGEIPMLTMTIRQGKWLGTAYSVMLAFAVLTTGVSNGFSITDIVGRKIGRKKTALFAVMIAFCMSGSGFSKLIDVLYGICGYIGIGIVIMLMISAVKMRKK